MLAPDAVIVDVPPTQIALDVGVTDSTGAAFTVNVYVLTQPAALVPVNV